MSDEAKAKEKQVLVGGGMGMIVCTSLYTPHPSFPPTPPLKQHPYHPTLLFLCLPLDHVLLI